MKVKDFLARQLHPEFDLSAWEVPGSDYHPQIELMQTAVFAQTGELISKEDACNRYLALVTQARLEIGQNDLATALRNAEAATSMGNQ